MFSSIATRLHGETNALYDLRDSLVRRGIPVRDLISGNINEEGFVFPPDRLEEILVRGIRKSLVYRPDSFGLLAARESVSEYYGRRDIPIDPGNILLTPGTSQSYWYCFKLLADAGDEILCPRPSYPLFDYIALLSGVRLIPYDLDERNGWSLDADRLEAGISTRTRAIVLISPHNPTGHMASAAEIARLADIAARHNIAIISDEVFSEFLQNAEALPRPAGSGAPLVFTLNGFSKMFALPGIKLGWMAVSGNPDLVKKAMKSLELISDTFLPVNEIVQAAVPDIFREGESVCADFSSRIGECWRNVKEYLDTFSNSSYVEPDGGFYVTIRLDGINEEVAAKAALKENHILIHPGYFYDMKLDHLVLSFVHRPEMIRDSLPMLKNTLFELRTGS